MTKTSYLTDFLTRLLNGETLVSGDLMASNSNQYFATMKNNDIELIEVYKPNLTNKGRSKHRRLNMTPENIKKAKEYLSRLQGIKNEDSTKD